MHLLGHGPFAGQLASQLRTHRGILVIGTLVTAAYTLLVWWFCHPFVKHFDRLYRCRRPGRWWGVGPHKR